MSASPIPAGLAGGEFAVCAHLDARAHHSESLDAVNRSLHAGVDRGGDDQHAVLPPHIPTVLARSQVLGVGTATPEPAFTQQELIERYLIKDRRIRSVLLNGGIERRYLCLPDANPAGGPAEESQSKLLKKHCDMSLLVGAKALRNCLQKSELDLLDIDYLCVVTTTGFLVPGLSALLIKELGLRKSTSRVDIVGMGCNAGLNGMNVVSSWAVANPGKIAVMLCVEICSAAYVYDERMEIAVVNALFGDGAAAVALCAGPNVKALPAAVSAPRLEAFASHVICDAVDAMRFDWDDQFGKFSFRLDPAVPYVVGANAEEAIDRLLRPRRLRRSQIAHWLVHSGGKKVIDSVKINLGLTEHDLRHTRGVLRDYGNVSSGSFLFSYERLLGEAVIQHGDYGVMMTMGPGSTIETALLHWPEPDRADRIEGRDRSIRPYAADSS